MNRTTKAERADLLARIQPRVELDAEKAVVNFYDLREQVMEEYGISRERATGIIAKAARILRRPV